MLTLAVVSPILATHSAVFARLLPEGLLRTPELESTAATSGPGGDTQAEPVEEVVPPW